MGYGVKNLWPNNTVNYMINSNVPDWMRNHIYFAINEQWQKFTPIRFVEYTKPPKGDYVTFVASNRNSSGMGSGTYQVELNRDYTSQGHTVHEIGHVLGLDHEQDRPDAGGFLTKPDASVSLNLAHECGCGAPYPNCLEAPSVVLGPYDYDSVMHYPGGLAGVVPTIWDANPGRWRPNANPANPSLSPGDRWAIHLLYRTQTVYLLGSTGKVSPFVYADLVNAIRNEEQVSVVKVFTDNEDKWIRGYQINVFGGPSGSRWLDVHGDPQGCKEHEFYLEFQNGEVIRAITGKYGGVIDSLTFHTSKGKEYSFGGPGGDREFLYTVPVGQGLEIVGLAGYLLEDGKRIGSVGAVIRGSFTQGATHGFTWGTGGVGQGERFHDGGFAPKEIRRIGFWSDKSGLVGLETREFDSQTGTYPVIARHGGRWGTYSTLDLYPNEYVCGVEGRTGGWVDYIRFVLRDKSTGAQRRSSSYGGVGGEMLLIHEFPPGYRLCGFTGWADSNRLYALGSVFKPL